MKLTGLFFSAAVLFTFVGSISARADAIPYGNTGVVATEVPVYAMGSGGITVYFLGSNAAFTDYIRVSDLQTGFVSGDFLNNHTSALGSSVQIGTGAGEINAGDQLVFYINSPQGLLGSLGAFSPDGKNHAYITTYSGGTVGSTAVPAGLYVGLEDAVGGDFDYNDDSFAFTGVTAPSVAVTPEPSSLVLLGTGLVSITTLVRRRMARS